jgi:hypothetical protein
MPIIVMRTIYRPRALAVNSTGGDARVDVTRALCDRRATVALTSSRTSSTQAAWLGLGW